MILGFKTDSKAYRPVFDYEWVKIKKTKKKTSLHTVIMCCGLDTSLEWDAQCSAYFAPKSDCNRL